LQDFDIDFYKKKHAKNNIYFYKKDIILKLLSTNIRPASIIKVGLGTHKDGEK
jgi:hypothetical protein